MPYSSVTELPESVQDALPVEAQHIWMSAFNGALEQGHDEQTAARIAWAAVKDAGWSQDNEGNWRKRWGIRGAIFQARAHTQKAKVTEEEFPEGLHCFRCDKDIPAGDDYWYAPTRPEDIDDPDERDLLEFLTAIIGEPPVSIVCEDCKEGKVQPKSKAADDSKAKGVALCFGVKPNVAKLLSHGAGPGGEKPEMMHATLAYFGHTGDEVQDADLKKLEAAAEVWAKLQSPIVSRFGGVGRFFGMEEDALVVLLDAPGINEFREAMIAEVEKVGVSASKEHSFTPHITVRYLAPDEEAVIQIPDESLVFDKLELWVGPEHKEFQIGNQEEPGDADEDHDYGDARDKSETFTCDGCGEERKQRNFCPECRKAFCAACVKKADGKCPNEKCTSPKVFSDVHAQTEAFALRLQGYSYQHIAKRIGCTPRQAHYFVTDLTMGNLKKYPPATQHDLVKLARLPKMLQWKSLKAAVTDRYDALGLPHPDPELMCSGQCEGTGVVPMQDPTNFEDLVDLEDWEEQQLTKRWEEARTAGLVDPDGWAFVTCPVCEGSCMRREISEEPSDGIISSHPVPVYEENGAINRSACHAVADALVDDRTGLGDERRRAAALELVAIFRLQLREEPPQALLDVLGQRELAFKTTVGIWKAKTQDRKRYTFAPVYAPDVRDQHGEWTDRETLEKAAREFAKLNDNNVYLQHTKKRAGIRTDWVTWPQEVVAELTLPDGRTEKVKFPAGTLFMGVEWDEAVWPMVLEGRITGYSLGGTVKASKQRLEVMFADRGRDT